MVNRQRMGNESTNASGRLRNGRWTVERLQTADGVGQAFEAARKGQTFNEWGTNQRMRTAERRRQNRRQTADRGRREGTMDEER